MMRTKQMISPLGPRLFTRIHFRPMITPRRAQPPFVPVPPRPALRVSTAGPCHPDCRQICHNCPSAPLSRRTSPWC